MGYRGEDLDLRTPQTWSATQGDLASSAGEPSMPSGRGRRSAMVAPRNGPIWVDDTVLAVCNHAFDVAAAHRASEVRIEHLLHAMTRIDTAAEVLEERGIRVAGLRRDSATVIAGELPVASAASQTPRRSNDLAEVLRLAAANAYRRNAPATVEDVLYVLEAKPELPGMQLISRHGGHMAHEMMEPPPMPPRQPAYVPEPPRYAQPEPERMRTASRPASYRASEPLRAPVDYRVSERAPADNGRPTMTDSFQNARLDALEQAVRSLGAELADERTSFSTILQDLQRDLGAQRDDASRHSGGLHDRLATIEQIVARPRDDGGRTADMIDRLVAIEQNLQHRLNDLTRSWNGLAGRIEAIELAVQDAATQPRGNEVAAFNALSERLTQVERTVRDGLSEGARNWIGLGDKLKAFEQAVASPLVNLDLGPLSSRLDFIEEALLGRDSEPTRELGQCLEAVEGAVAAVRAQTFETSAALGAEVKAVAGALATQATSAERFQASVAERLTALATGLERSKTEIAAAASAPVAERIMQLTQAGERQHADVKATFDTYEKRLVERTEAQRGELTAALLDIEQKAAAHRSETGAALLGLDQKMQALAVAQRGELAILGVNLGKELAAFGGTMDGKVQSIADTQMGYGRDLAEVHDALVKLNANQHTLAGSIEQWRTDASGDLGIIANRIGTLERETQKPMQLLSAVASNMDTVHRIAVDRNNRRRRFWYWLFGTDDWLAASWPEQSTRIDTARLAAKTRKP